MTTSFDGSGLDNLDVTGSLSRLRTSAEGGNLTAGVEYVDKAFSAFRIILIVLFVFLFVAALMGIISGGFLLVAADQDVDQHDQWKARARGLGGADIAFMALFLAFSVYALYVMLRYEKAMGYMLHRFVKGETPAVKTAQQHLQMTNAVQMHQLPQQMGYPAAMPTTGAAVAAPPNPGVFDFS